MHGFMIRNVAGNGLEVTGSGVVVKDVRIDFTYSTALLINKTTSKPRPANVLIEGVHISRFNDKDVVRHALVGRIVRAYEADTAKRLEEQQGGHKA